MKWPLWTRKAEPEHMFTLTWGVPVWKALLMDTTLSGKADTPPFLGKQVTLHATVLPLPTTPVLRCPSAHFCSVTTLVLCNGTFKNQDLMEFLSPRPSEMKDLLQDGEDPDRTSHLFVCTRNQSLG